MQIAITDNQQIGEVDAQAFQLFMQGPVSANVTLNNGGVNPVNYRFQEYVVPGGTWHDLDALGTDLNNTLAAGGTVATAVVSAYNQVRLMANASGGALLTFGTMQRVDRTSGGQLPIINF